MSGSADPIVVLGLYDGEVTKEDELGLTAYDSKLGGHPIFPSKPDQSLLDSLKCSKCKSNLYFLLQIYCPTYEKDRFIFVFCCNRNDCSREGKEGWKIFRFVKDLSGSMEELKTTNGESLDLNKTECLFDSKVTIDDLNDLLEHNFSIQNTKSVPPINESFMTDSYHFTDLPAQYDAHLIYIEDEQIDKKREKERMITISYDISTESDPQLDAFFDSFGIAATLSEEYKNFQKVLSYNPSQLLRYQLNGIPLSIEPNQQFDCGNCKCGGKRRFEFQIISTVISVLDCENDKYTGGSSSEFCHSSTALGGKKGKSAGHSDFSKSNAMDWESVYIFTCENDCNTNILEECIVK